MKQDDAQLVTEIERATWDRSAENYLDGAAALTGAAVPLLIEAAQICSGKHVLDIGCGPGHITQTLAATGARVTGVDLSSEMIKVAQRHYPALTFQEANVEQLPFDPNTFDVVVGNYVVHHFARPDAAFREIHRVLKPGGCFVFATAMETSGFGAFIAGVAAHYTLDELPHGPLYLVTDKSVFESTIHAGGFTKYQLEIRDLSLCARLLSSSHRGTARERGDCLQAEEAMSNSSLSG